MILKLISKIVGFLARIEFPQFLLNTLVRLYIIAFRVNREDFVRALGSYSSLDDFFTREIKPESRPIAKTPLVFPADGKLLLTGRFEEETQIEVKGLKYHLKTLFGGHQDHNIFKGGSYSVIYLSPSDYHCVHSPVAGCVKRTIHIAGYLRTVCPSMSSSIENTFVENERVISLLEMDNGRKVAVILVGALNVGSIEISYLESGQQPKADIGIHHGIQLDFQSSEYTALEKGELLGKFHLGSTVIVCTEKDSFQLDNSELGKHILFGNAMGTISK